MAAIDKARERELIVAAEKAGDFANKACFFPGFPNSRISWMFPRFNQTAGHDPDTLIRMFTNKQTFLVIMNGDSCRGE